jgi:hypothetical protein
VNTKVTFELKDLPYDELIDTYKEIIDFIKFLDETKDTVVDKDEEKVE